MEWILILVVTIGGYGAQGKAVTQEVPGYATQEACKKAGKQAQDQLFKQSDEAITAHYACIERPR